MAGMSLLGTGRLGAQVFVIYTHFTCRWRLRRIHMHQVTDFLFTQGASEGREIQTRRFKAIKEKAALARLKPAAARLQGEAPTPPQPEPWGGEAQGDQPRVKVLLLPSWWVRNGPAVYSPLSQRPMRGGGLSGKGCRFPGCSHILEGAGSHSSDLVPQLHWCGRTLL